MMCITRFFLTVISALLLTGCIGLSFTEKKYETNRHVSIGNELIDLRTAYDEGLLNDEEYEAARQEILKSGTTDKTEQTGNNEKKGE